MLKRLIFLPALLVAVAPVSAQTFEEFGTWQYVKGSGTEAMHTESTDADRTFSLEVQCDEGEPAVRLGFLLATPADDMGLDPERFAPDGKVTTHLDDEKTGAGDWSFSTDSEMFVNKAPVAFLAAVENVRTMVIQVWDADGTSVGSYSFDLRGIRSALAALTCYEGGGQSHSSLP